MATLYIMCGKRIGQIQFGFQKRKLFMVEK